MDRFFSSPKSPLVDTPVCDSDEEVFVGPVTSKELQKASQLKRRTQFYFPSFDWKPSVSPLAAQSTNDKKDSTTRPELSLSADSLESQSYVTSSEKPEDSSKGDYWSALSGNSLSSNSPTSLNEAHMFSKFSEDSLESEEAPSTVKKCPPKSAETCRTTSLAPRGISFHSNVSEDSLEESSKQHLNDGKFFSRISGDSSDNSESLSREPKAFIPSMKENIFMHNQAKPSTDTFSKYEESFTSYSSKGLNTTQVLSDSLKSKDESAHTALATTYEVLPEVEVNDTYTVANESSDCQIVDHSDLSNNDKDLPNEVTADKDGGFLSILSEAALYHASHLQEVNGTDSQALEDSRGTTQSLEDRFKVFGIDAGDLEDQQLSESIMYVTGRESNVIQSETENNTFFTGRNSAVGSTVRTFDEQASHALSGELETLSSFSSPGSQQEPTQSEKIENINVTVESIESAKSGSNALNQHIQNSTLGSAGSAFQDSGDSSYQQGDCHNKRNENWTLDGSGNYGRMSSRISGICPLTSMTDSQNDSPNTSYNQEEQLHNDSGASSCVGELNDTLEEYEMMMKYGVDYILGRKGNKKNVNTDSEDMAKVAEIAEESPSYHDVYDQNTSSSSVEYLDAVDVSPHHKQFANTRVKVPKTLSPCQKQVLRCTPQKLNRDAKIGFPKPNVLKMPSKLPRVASVPPPRRMLTPSPQKAKQLTRPITPSSETKACLKSLSRPLTPSETRSGHFKKPIAPAVAQSRIPKTSTHLTPKSNQKILEKIQSPVGAYIHNSPLPVLVTNVKAKMVDKAPFEKEMHARAVWRAGEMKSCIPRIGNSQGMNAENVNPNIGCGLPAVKYTKAPCITLDEVSSKLPIPRVGEKITKLMEAPSPQVIKHEGRLRVNCGSPQLAAKMQSMADTFDDSIIDAHSVSGDISVCVTQTACRTNTLGH